MVIYKHQGIGATLNQNAIPLITNVDGTRTIVSNNG
jgi:hypothetical protein